MNKSFIFQNNLYLRTLELLDTSLTTVHSCYDDQRQML